MRQCKRCAGLVVAVVCVSAVDEAGLAAWRCVACGDLTDPLIEANRQRQAPRVQWAGYLGAVGGAKGRAATLAACLS